MQLIASLVSVFLITAVTCYDPHSNKYNSASNGWSLELAATSSQQPTLANPSQTQELDQAKNQNSKTISDTNNDWTSRIGGELVNGATKGDGLTVGFLSNDNQATSNDNPSATYAELNSLKSQLAALQQANNLSHQQGTKIDEYTSSSNQQSAAQQQANYVDYPLQSNKAPLLSRLSSLNGDTLDRIDSLASQENGQGTSNAPLTSYPLPNPRLPAPTLAPPIAARPLAGASNHATSIWNPFVHHEDWLPLLNQQALLMSQARQQLPHQGRSQIGAYFPGVTTRAPPGPWLRAFGSKRRSYDPLSISDSQRAAKVNFDDLTPPDARFEPMVESSQRAPTTSKRDYFASIANLPMLYESASAPAVKHFGTKYHEEDTAAPLLDNLLSASKYSSINHHPPTPSSYYSFMPSASPSAATAYYPAYAAMGHHHHKLTAALHPRKGLEKSLGVPILVGIGAALISFLIISNLFLSIPLFAMTFMQFMNGNSFLLPNNQPQTQPSQLTTPATPTNPLGRKKRSIDSELLIDLEQRVKKAISNIF